MDVVLLNRSNFSPNLENEIMSQSHPFILRLLLSDCFVPIFSIKNDILLSMQIQLMNPQFSVTVVD